MADRWQIITNRTELHTNHNKIVLEPYTFANQWWIDHESTMNRSWINGESFWIITNQIGLHTKRYYLQLLWKVRHAFKYRWQIIVNYVGLHSKHNLVLPKWICKIRQICQILLKCSFYFTQNTSNLVQNVHIKYLRHSRMK